MMCPGKIKIKIRPPFHYLSRMIFIFLIINCIDYSDSGIITEKINTGVRLKPALHFQHGGSFHPGELL
jgi:hypothetical protein